MLPINISIGISQPQAGLSLPEGGEYVYLEHDDLARDWKGQRIRAPEVWPLYWVEYCDLNSAWQWYWFRVGLVHPYTGYETWDEKALMSSELDRLKTIWKSFTHGEKAFTNNHGTNPLKPDGSNGGVDYINGIQNAGKMAKQGAITCCGNIFRKISSTSTKGVAIETLDGDYPPPPIEKINRLTRPDLIFCSVNIPGYVQDGKEFPHFITSGPNAGRVKADPFPNLEALPASKSIDMCVPLRTKGSKSDLRYMRDGVRYARNYISNAVVTRLKPYTERVVKSPYVR